MTTISYLEQSRLEMSETTDSNIDDSDSSNEGQIKVSGA